MRKHPFDLMIHSLFNNDLSYLIITVNRFKACAQAFGVFKLYSFFKFPDYFIVKRFVKLCDIRFRNVIFRT